MWRAVNSGGDLPPVQNGVAYAYLNRPQLTSLAKAMPDAKSAILLCLAWYALRQSALNEVKMPGN
jgi:hypothetical protein